MFLKINTLFSIRHRGWGIWSSISLCAAAAAKSLQSCPTLCDPMDCSLPRFSVHGILQARTLEWVAISFSNAWKWKVKVKSLSRVWLLVTPWTAAYQPPPSMGFSGHQYWSGVPLPSPSLCAQLCISNPQGRSQQLLSTGEGVSWMVITNQSSRTSSLHCRWHC